MAATGAALVNPKPSTNWDVLVGPIETRGQKAFRVFGQFLTFLTVPSAGAVYYVNHYMTDTPERVLAAYNGTRIFAVATGVAGAALWYFNSLGDLPQRLGAKRKNLETNITQIPLATIRKNNSPTVISNQELNEWMRYLLKEQNYAKFIELQTDDIFHLDLEEASMALLREKYRAYLRTPCALGMRALVKQRAFTDLINDTERLKAREITAEKEAQNADSYEKFIDRNGTLALNNIKKTEAKEQLFSKFLEHVRLKNLGLIETKKQFAKDIDAFGEKALKDVEELVQKLELISGKSYKEIRDRNGFDQIKLLVTGNPTVHTAFKDKFLELPYSVQVSEEYKADRDLLNITRDDIKKAMTSRWLSKRYSEILKTERDDFLACVKAGVLNPREWTAKAVLETLNLSIQAILKDYSDLFAIGVLNANDGNLKARAAQETADFSLAGLIDNYGDGIFIYDLLDPALVQRLVGHFVIIYSSEYMGNRSTSPYVNRVARLNLASFLAAEIQEGQRQLAQANTDHEKQADQINTRFDRRITVLNENLAIETTAEREAVRAAEEKLQQAEKAASPHAETIAQINSLSASYEAQIASANEQLDNKSTEKETLLAEQQNLNSESTRRHQASLNEKLRREASELSALELQSAASLRAAEKQVEELRLQLSECEKWEKYQELKALVESEDFQSKKQEFEKTTAVVTGVAAAKQAQQKKAELEAMKAKKTQLATLSSHFASQPFSLKKSDLQIQHSTLKAQMDGVNAEISTKRARVQQIRDSVDSYNRRLQQVSEKIDTLATEIRALRSTRATAEMHRGYQVTLVVLAMQAAQEPFAVRTAAQQALATAQQALESKTAQVKADIEQLKQQREKERSAALKAENSSYQATLLQLIQQFQEAILAKANPPPPSFG